MITKEDRIKMFANEIGYIADENLKKFAEKVLEDADDYFFTVPASSSGKYHPQFSLGESGLVRHTRVVAFFAKCIGESMMFNQHDIDLLVIAAIAHDIKKQGDNANGHTVGNHPEIAKNYILVVGTENENLISMDDTRKIASAVYSHMGKWGHENDNMPLPETDFDKALQSADYLASRKEILNFDFKPTETVVIEHNPNSAATPAINYDGDPKDYVLGFGKYKGQTIEAVAKTGYIDWMIKQDDFFNKEAQEMGKRYLDSLKNPKPIVENKAKTSDPVPSSEPIDDLPF